MRFANFGSRSKGHRIKYFFINKTSSKGDCWLYSIGIWGYIGKNMVFLKLFLGLFFKFLSLEIQSKL